MRSLSEFSVFVRSNFAITIIRKITKQSPLFLSYEVLPSNPFGFRTYVRGESSPFPGSVRFIHRDGIGYVARTEVEQSTDAIDTFNVLTTRAMSGGNKPSSDGSYLVIPSTMRVMEAGEICAETYICIGKMATKIEAVNLKSYLSTRFVRFLMLQAMTSIMISKDSFRFVPLEDFIESSEINWDTPIEEIDKQLYRKYELSESEVQFIESMIKPMT